MMLLIGVAISVAFLASWATELGAVDLDFWWELAALITVMLFGHWQEMKAIGRAGSALDALAELLPDEAERIVDGSVETVRVDELSVGELVLVRPGGRRSRRWGGCRRRRGDGRIHGDGRIEARLATSG